MKYTSIKAHKPKKNHPWRNLRVFKLEKILEKIKSIDKPT